MVHSSCEHCGSVVEVTATCCPSCGHPVPQLHLDPEGDLRDRRLAELLAHARQAQQDGDLALALRSARQALALRPDCSTTHALLGQLYEQSGNTEAAHYHFQSALSVTPPQAAADTTTLAATTHPSRPSQSGWMMLVLVGCVLASGLAVLFSFLPEARREQQGAVLEMPLARPPLAEGRWTWLTPPEVEQTETVTVRSVPAAERVPTHPASVAVAAPDATHTNHTAQPSSETAQTEGPLQVLGPSARERMPASSAIPLVRQADQAYWRGEYGRAALIFEDVLRQADHPNPRLHHDLACCYQQLGNSPKAAEHLQQAIQGYQALLADDPQNAVVQEELKRCEAALDDLLGTRERAAIP